MSSHWTVEPDVVRKVLTWRGRELWVDLKKQLTTGEQKRIDASGIRSMTRRTDITGREDLDMELNIDLDAATFMKTKTWLVDWSLKDDQGTKLPLTIDTLRALNPLFTKVIEIAVDEHAKSVSDMERDLEKKVLTSGSSPALTSVS